MQKAVIQLERNQAKQRWELRNGQNTIGTCPASDSNAVCYDLKKSHVKQQKKKSHVTWRMKTAASS